MKRFLYSLFTLTFMVCMYAACASKEPMQPVVEPTPPVKVSSQEILVVAQDNWAFTLPSNDWKLLSDLSPQITRGYLNKKLTNLVLFIKEPFSGTLEQYILIALTDIKKSGATIKSGQIVEINEQKYVFVDVVDPTGENQILMWISFNAGYGYIFSCASPLTKQAAPMCDKIAHTLKI